jgi:biopolymer transport protein ExbD
MRLKSSEGNEEPELSVVPLVDVMLLLLIFFMVTTTFVDEARIKVQLPQASTKPAPNQQRDRIEITVTSSGEFRVSGKTLLNTSPSTLSAAVSKVAGQSRDIPITIRADARATHQAVITAMDVVGRLGFKTINIATLNEDGRR